MAESFESAGIRVAAVVVDAIDKNAAMIDKLLLPFPILSDPEARVIKAWGVYNEPEEIAEPAIFLVHSDLGIGHSYIGRDYADRPTDEELFAAVPGAGFRG
jgi:peroxiredoxin